MDVEEDEAIVMTTDVSIVGSTPATRPSWAVHHIGIRLSPATVSFDDVSPVDFKRMSLIWWFDRTSVLADADAKLSSLAHYAWKDELLYGESTDAHTCNVWQNIIAVYDVYLANFGIIDVKRTRHVASVAKGLLTFAGGWVVDNDANVDLWRYWVCSELLYVANLCSFTENQLSAWCGRYMV